MISQETAPAPRHLGADGAIVRRRIFARLREGLDYDEIGALEGVTTERVRQIVAEALQNTQSTGTASACRAASGPGLQRPGA